MTQLKIAQNPLPKFAWENIDPEFFRGPELSFPTSIDILMAKAFNTLVISATDSFEEYFMGSYLDPECEGFTPVILDQITDAGGFTRVLGEGDLGLRMHYMCGTTKILILNLDHPENVGTRH